MQELEEFAARFREAIHVGSVCVALLTALGQGELLEQTVEIEVRRYRISAQAVPLKLEIEPMDN